MPSRCSAPPCWWARRSNRFTQCGRRSRAVIAAVAVAAAMAAAMAAAAAEDAVVAGADRSA
ncbi:exported hypothetical protein [Erythrobacter sp. EC-HK427]|nr:exported hypothetical protein [Erythrobacter sp. EC-HK427]